MYATAKVLLFRQKVGQRHDPESIFLVQAQEVTAMMMVLIPD